MRQNTPGLLDILAALLKGLFTFHLTACTAGVCRFLAYGLPNFAFPGQKHVQNLPGRLLHSLVMLTQRKPEFQVLDCEHFFR